MSNINGRNKKLMNALLSVEIKVYWIRVWGRKWNSWNHKKGSNFL
jgi:hypothetical protein